MRLALVPVMENKYAKNISSPASSDVQRVFELPIKEMFFRTPNFLGSRCHLIR